MTPGDIFCSSTYQTTVFKVDSGGKLNTSQTDNITGYGTGIRPVINLRSDVTFNSGSDGTQNNPYIVQ